MRMDMLLEVAYLYDNDFHRGVRSSEMIAVARLRYLGVRSTDEITGNRRSLILTT